MFSASHRLPLHRVGTEEPNPHPVTFERLTEVTPIGIRCIQYIGLALALQRHRHELAVCRVEPSQIVINRKLIEVSLDFGPRRERHEFAMERILPDSQYPEQKASPTPGCPDSDALRWYWRRICQPLSRTICFSRRKDRSAETHAQIQINEPGVSRPFAVTSTFVSTTSAVIPSRR